MVNHREGRLMCYVTYSCSNIVAKPTPIYILWKQITPHRIPLFSPYQAVNPSYSCNTHQQSTVSQPQQAPRWASQNQIPRSPRNVFKLCMDLLRKHRGARQGVRHAGKPSQHTAIAEASLCLSTTLVVWLCYMMRSQRSICQYMSRYHHTLREYW